MTTDWAGANLSEPQAYRWKALQWVEVNPQESRLDNQGEAQRLHHAVCMLQEHSVVCWARHRSPCYCHLQGNKVPAWPAPQQLGTWFAQCQSRAPRSAAPIHVDVEIDVPDQLHPQAQTRWPVSAAFAHSRKARSSACTQQ